MKDLLEGVVRQRGNIWRRMCCGFFVDLFLKILKRLKVYKFAVEGDTTRLKGKGLFYGD